MLTDAELDAIEARAVRTGLTGFAYQDVPRLVAEVRSTRARLRALYEATRDHSETHPTYGPEYCDICKAAAAATEPAAP